MESTTTRRTVKPDTVERESHSTVSPGKERECLRAVQQHSPLKLPPRSAVPHESIAEDGNLVR